MAGKVRAYKLAEELGIDRSEFVERAKAVGFELRSPMAALDEGEANSLREKLGGRTEAHKNMEEARVQRSGGPAVIRRRKRVQPEPEPEPVVAEPEPIEAERSAVEDAAAAESGEEVGHPEAELPATPEPIAPVAADVAAPAPVAPAPALREVTAAPAPSVRPEGGAPDRKGKQRKRVREVVNLREQEQFARQVTSRGGPQRRPAPLAPRATTSPRRKRRDAPAKLQPKAPAAQQARVVRVEGEISVGELAKQLGAKAAEIQGKLMALGIMVSVNQGVDVETVKKLTEPMGVQVADVGFKEEVFFDTAPSEEVGDDANLVTRSPIITMMGHVDHGKTSLLDTIRKARVVEGEAGGITQHIGAYQTKSGDGMLTFIDTPGHAAFTAMRARGANATDIVVLVVAATEGVMPQTVEAIDHARAAGCPIVVAINKCDLPEADPQRSRQKLMEHNLVPEEFGGDVICVNVSATTGEGIDQLLEMLALQAEVLELKADPTRRARGVVLEAELDKGKGPIATVLVQDGTLERGQYVVVGAEWGRVRLMENDRGERVKEAGPSVPVQVMGLSGVPAAGVELHVVESERVAKQIIGHRADSDRSGARKPKSKLSLEEFFARQAGEGSKELNVVLKADVHGTCEAVRDALEKLSTPEVKLTVLSSAVGGISENDVLFAQASEAIVVGFNVRPDPVARRAAESNGVDIRVYQVIMKLTDEVRDAMAGLLPPRLEEIVLGRAEVRETFTIPKLGTIAGSFITEGKVRRGAQCRLIRDGVQIYDGRVGSLKRFKDDAREVQTGFECGIGIEGYNDVKNGDVIEVYEFEEKPATLS